MTVRFNCHIMLAVSCTFCDETRVEEYPIAAEFRSERLFGTYRADFYLLDHAIDLECDGTHWHSGPEAAAKDRKRDKYFQTLGIRVIRLKQKAIEKNPLSATRNALQKAGVLCG